MEIKMSNSLSRRRFLGIAAAGAGASFLAQAAPAQADQAAAGHTARQSSDHAVHPHLGNDHVVKALDPNKPLGLKLAVKIGMVGEKLSLTDKFKLLRDLGFDGVEMDSPNQLATKDVLAARDASGLPIHGVVNSVHWRDTLSDPKPEVRAKGLAGLETALQDAKDYGATSCLLVPGVVRKNVRYDQVYVRSQTEIRKALPLAEKLGIAIGIENVWNGFLLSPVEACRYLDELNSPTSGCISTSATSFATAILTIGSRRWAGGSSSSTSKNTATPSASTSI
jgi:hypothetical protein